MRPLRFKNILRKRIGKQRALFLRFTFVSQPKGRNRGHPRFTKAAPSHPRGRRGDGTMKPEKLFQDPHRRFNPLTGDWVLVSPHRTERPWHGQSEPPEPEPVQSYDPDCYLCPGNVRAGSIRNPAYSR